MTSEYYYITTPIYYVNDIPHIGSAYTTIAADALARFMRLDGRHVKFITGTDEHGQKVFKSARDRGIDTQLFVDQTSQRFRDLFTTLQLTHDDFIRTSEPRHYRAAQALWTQLNDAGYIYKGNYAGWYCVRDEAFYAEDELVDGKAPTGADVEWVEEESYFFALSKFQQPLLDYYRDHPDFIKPTSRRNEVLRFVESGLHDLSISRTSFTWGIPVPGDDKHVMYVWLDALANYLTVLGFPEQSDDFQQLWPQAVHLVGKDILRFHAVYWPAFLMAAGISLPKTILAHGWWTVEGQKISKSLGNAIDPIPFVEKYGLDQLRYFLLAEKPLSNDGDFSERALVTKINANLANDYGNLVQRVLSFIHKNADGVIPQPGELTDDDRALLQQTRALPDLLRQEAEHQNTYKMCEHLWLVISSANRYVDAQAPWTLKKTDRDRMDTVLYILVDVIRFLSVLTSPIVPHGSAKIMDQLNLPADQRSIAALSQPLVVGTELPTPSGVFPRFERIER